MATLTVKNIPEPLVRRLKQRAALHRRSLNLEVISCLERATQAALVDVEAELARIRAIRKTPVGFKVTDALLKELRDS